MMLRWREYERNMRRRARAEIKRLPKAQRPSNSFWTRHFSLPELQWLAWFIVMPLVSLMGLKNSPPSVYFSMASLWVTTAAFWLTSAWLKRLGDGERLRTLENLPLSWQERFAALNRWMTGRFLWLVFSMTGFYWLMFSIIGMQSWTTAPAMALAQLVITVATAVHLAAWAPRFPWGFFAFASALGLVVARDSKWVLSILSEDAWIPAVLPGGWAHAASHGNWWALLAMAGLCYAVGPSFRRVSVMFQGASREVVDSAEETPELPSAENATTQTSEGLRQSDLLARADWSRNGWLDRLIWKCFRPDEKRVAEFQFGRAPMMSGSIIRLAIALSSVFLIGSIWGFATGKGAPNFGLSIGIGAFFSFFFMPSLTTFFSFRDHTFVGWKSPMFIAFPLGYDEMWRMVLKFNLITLAAAAPLWVCYTALVEYRLSGAWTGAIVGLKIVLYLAALQPLLISIGPASSSSGATMGWKVIGRFFAWGIVLCVMLAALIGSAIGLFGFGLLTAPPLVSVKDGVALLVALIASWSGYRLLRREYRGRALDLIERAQ